MKSKTVFFCTECGNETARWQGKCPACGAWNSLVEGVAEPAAPAGKGRASVTRRAAKPVTLREVGAAAEERFSTGVEELDRVLGGGARASFGKNPRFQIQLDKRPLSPGTSREAGGAPCLNPRRGLTLLSPVCRDPAIGV